MYASSVLARPVAVKLAVKITPERTTTDTHTIFVDIRPPHIERFDPLTVHLLSGCL